MELFSFYLIILIQPGILLMGLGIIYLLYVTYHKHGKIDDGGRNGGLLIPNEVPGPVPSPTPVRDRVLW